MMGAGVLLARGGVEKGEFEVEGGPTVAGDGYPRSLG